jgi:quercetin dioxygenase-like cupin family protein
VIEGELVDWHSHEHEDEFFLVLEERLELEVEGVTWLRPTGAR